MAKPESQTNDKALEEAMKNVRKMCQHVSTNLQQQNSLIQVLQKSLDSQQEIIQKQGRQIEILGNKLKRLTNIVVDKLQEAVEDIEEPEYEEDGYRRVLPVFVHLSSSCLPLSGLPQIREGWG